MAHDKQVKDSNPEKAQPQEDSGKTTKSMKRFLETLTKLLKDLCHVYAQEYDQDLLMLWAEATRDMREELLMIGYHETLRRHENFLPTPAQFRVYAEDAASRLAKHDERPVVYKRNVLDETREIAREIESTYDKLDPVRDASRIKFLMRQANIVRYLRMGIEPKWLISEEVENARQYV